MAPFADLAALGGAGGGRTSRSWQLCPPLAQLSTSLAIAWAIFASLLFGHWRFGWRGRTAARYTIAGFVALALAYFGSKFVLETLLGRHWG